MEFSYEKGQRLVIELTNAQIFEGDCEKCAKDRIDIVNVIEYPNSDKLEGRLSYYRCEIASVHVLDQELKGAGATKRSQLNNGATPQPDRKTITLLREEYQRLKDMTTSYTYMATMDNRYLNAVNHLSNCENVGVVGIGSQVGRMKRISLLVLTSWDKVYLFDLLLYSVSKKEFPSDLRLILESDQIKKVVHDSQTLFDCLWHSHKVKLNNIFDTCVSDMVLEKTQMGCAPEKKCNLSECLARYLNFPDTFLEQAMEVDLKEWEKRPVDDLLKIQASQLATYLITLKNKQEEMMLKGFYRAVRIYSPILANSDGFMARKFLSTKDVVPEEIKEIL